MKNIQIASQVPPHSAEAERAVLGAMFQQKTALLKVLEHLEENDFYMPMNREIFNTIVYLNQHGQPTDEITVIAHLQQRNALAQAGGVAYIAELQGMLPALTNLQHYINLIKENSTLRKLLTACENIQSDIYSGQEETQTILSVAEKRIFQLSLQTTSRGLRPLESIIADAYMEISESAGKVGVTGLPTGFVDLDTKLSGLQKSDLIVVAGRPAMGKTSFAINIAQHAATKEDALVAVFSLEMSMTQLAKRMLCTEARVDMQNVKSGQLNDHDWNSMASVLPELGSAKLYIDDTAGISLSEMRSKLRQLKMEQGGKLDLVVIDYLQLMTYRGKTDSRQLQVSETTRELKIMARDLDVPIILLSQLSRAPDQRTDHRPMLSDLRESGSIEQDADIVIMLYRESVYDPDCENPLLAQAIVSKHRNGATGDVNLIWRGEHTRFENATQYDNSPPF